MLKNAGYEVVWADGIAEKMTEDDFIDLIKKEKPDIIAIESKTPVIKRHWKFIDYIKKISANNWKMKTALFGDHVTALPEESMQNSPVDYVLTGGDYDFLLLNLANHLSKNEKLEPGIWYRNENKNSKIGNWKLPALSLSNGGIGNYVNTGHFVLDHNLNELPMINRELTKWKLYAYENGNYKKTPGTYTMAGRDCWWGKCTFCFPPGVKINTNKGFLPIEKIVANEQSLQVLTNNGKYKRITKRLFRPYNGQLIDIEPYYIQEQISTTLNHSLFICQKENFNNPKIKPLAANRIKEGDYLVLPINRKVRDIKIWDLTKIVCSGAFEIKTNKKISLNVIDKIQQLQLAGISQRKIAEQIGINRETVCRYLKLIDHNEVETKINPLIEDDFTLRFEGGKKAIVKKIRISSDLMRLIGYYLAEGHSSRHKSRPNSGSIGFTFSKKEKNYIKDVKQIFKQHFKLTLNQIENKANNTIQLYFGSTVLARAFQISFGDSCLNKSIPFSFMQLSPKKQKQLLLGLFRGDGHIRKLRKTGEEFIFDTTSEKLVKQIYILLLRQNIIASLRLPKFGKKTKHQKYSIHLYGQDIKKIFSDYKNKKLRQHHQHKGLIFKNHAFIPIKKITQRKYSGFVYNLTVEKDHSYTVGFVAVQNCSWTTIYPKFRTRTPESLLDEVEILVNKYHVKEIMDDTGCFPAGGWLEKFCKGMIERKLNKKVIIDCNMRVNALNKQQYELMAKAGFRFILYGLESANQETLDKINKNIKVEDIENGAKMAKGAGLEPHMTCMVGYPWEKLEDAERTIALTKKLFNKGYIDTLQATVVMPYPGTPLFKYCQENNLLKTSNWEEYDMRRPIMKSPISDQKLMELTQGLYKSFLTPKFIIRKIFSIRGTDDIKFLWRSGMKFIGHLLDFK